LSLPSIKLLATKIDFTFANFLNGENRILNFLFIEAYLWVVDRRRWPIFLLALVKVLRMLALLVTLLVAVTVKVYL
jgi:hypothetical protein